MRVLVKKPRQIDVDGRKITVSKFEKHLVNDNRDFHTQFGLVKQKDLEKSKIKIGKEMFYAFDSSFIDEYKKIKRLAQIISLKDIGSIIANTGLNKDSKFVEAGTGSAGVSSFLSRIVKEIVSYDIKPEHQTVAKENLDMLKATNVTLKRADIYKPKTVDKEEADVFLLDVTEPWNAVKTAKKILKTGGFLVVYNPHINQLQMMVNSLTEEFIVEKAIEVNEREWSIGEKILRPRMKELSHTGFLLFIRKIL